MTSSFSYKIFTKFQFPEHAFQFIVVHQHICHAKNVPTPTIFIKIFGKVVRNLGVLDGYDFMQKAIKYSLHEFPPNEIHPTGRTRDTVMKSEKLSVPI